MVRGFGLKAALRAVGGHRRSPLVAGVGRVERVSGGWPGGWAAQGTLQVRPCKLDRRIHAAHAPAQPTHPAPDRFLRGQPRKAEQEIKGRSRSLRSSLPDFRCSLVAGQGPALPQGIHAWRGSTADRRNLSKAGWVRWRGCPRHECRGQAPRGEGALLAKHCFASARTHSRQRLGRSGGLRRPPPPDPPRHPTGTQLLLWQLLLPLPLLLLLLLLLPLPWLRRVPGAARPEPFPRFRYNVGPVSQLRFPGHDGPRGRARPVAVPPRTS